MRIQVRMDERDMVKLARALLGQIPATMWVLRALGLIPALFALFAALDGGGIAALRSPGLWAAIGLQVFLCGPVFSRFSLWQGRRNGTMSADNFCFDIDLGRFGVAVWKNGERHAAYSYVAFTKIARTKDFILCISKASALVALPVACFEIPAQADEAFALLEQGVNNARVRGPEGFAPQPGACAYRISFMLDRPLLEAAFLLAGRRGGNNKFIRRFMIVLCSILVLVLVLLYVVGEITTGTLLVGCILAFTSLFLANGKGQQRVNAKQTPDYMLGPCVLEINETGTRMYNPVYEGMIPWSELTGLADGEGLSVLLRKRAVFAPLPWASVAPGQLAAVQSYINQHLLEAKYTKNSAG